MAAAKMSAGTKSLLTKITGRYLESGDFNGLPIREILGGTSPKLTLLALKELVTEEAVAIVFGDGHPNPHIRALPEHHSSAKQIELLDTDLALHACAYPLPKHLERVVDKTSFAGRPYILALALGQPQLRHYAFDMMILETYRNDPRYHYDTNDTFGTISASGGPGSMRQSDDVFLQSFGFAYDDDHNKYVAVFLRDLSRLSPEHQTLWQMREVGSKTFLHPDYYLASMGDWPEHVSLYQALLEELEVINNMAQAMDRPPLFRDSYGEARRPRGFGSLLRPTAREFATFVQLLDHLLSENLNKDFFRGEIPDKEEHKRRDGTTEMRPVGTIRMLESWLARNVRSQDTTTIEQCLQAFRNVRQLRQKPAHGVVEDRFDQHFIHKQRDLMLSSYKAVRTLRLIFANHPRAREVEVSDWLREGKIRAY